MNCPNCGKKLKENQKFCTQCGKKLKFFENKNNKNIEKKQKKIIIYAIAVILITVAVFLLNKYNNDIAPLDFKYNSRFGNPIMFYMNYHPLNRKIDISCNLENVIAEKWQADKEKYASGVIEIKGNSNDIDIPDIKYQNAIIEIGNPVVLKFVIRNKGAGEYVRIKKLFVDKNSSGLLELKIANFIHPNKGIRNKQKQIWIKEGGILYQTLNGCTESDILRKIDTLQEKYFRIIKRHDYLIQICDEGHEEDGIELSNLYEEVTQQIDKNNYYLKKYNKICQKYANNPGMTTYDMNTFAVNSYNATDKLLNEVYQAVKAKIPPDDFKNLEKSELKWIKDVDAYHKVFEQQGFGTVGTMVYWNYKTCMHSFRTLLLMLYL